MSKEINKRQIFFFACIGMLFFGVVLSSVGTLLQDIIIKFNLSENSSGTLVSLLPIGIIISSISCGVIIDRYGYKFLFFISMLLVCISLISVTYAPSSIFVQLSIFILGLSGGAINLLTNAVVAEVFVDSRGANLSWLGVSFGAGALGFPLIMGLFSNWIASSVLILIISIIFLIPTVVILLTQFPLPKIKQGFPIAEFKKIPKSYILILFGLALFFQSGMEGLTNNWTPLYLSKSMNIEKNNSLFALTSFSLGITIARLILGFLLRIIKKITVVYASNIISLISIILISISSNYYLLLTLYFCLGVGLASIFPIIFDIVGEKFKNIIGTAFSVILFIALIGNTILNYLVGQLSSISGIGIYLTILIISLILFTILFTISINLNK